MGMAVASAERRPPRWRDFAGALLAGAIVLACSFVLLWHDPLLFWNDDYELSILPIFADVARSWSEGHLPLVSPYSWTCSNLAGEFQYGTFSIFVNAAVILIWKLPLTFPQQAAALSMSHLFALAAGAFLLARGRNFSWPLAIMVALVASLNGWMICWGATDWFGALGALAWLPWCWWSCERALDGARSQWRFLWPAPFVYLLIAGGFPYTVLMLALLAGWLAMKSLGETRRLSSVWPLLVGVALGIGLSAPAWLALFDYVRGSARAAQESAAHFQWVVPIGALPGFILPSWTVSWINFQTQPMLHGATEMACGLIPPVALVCGLFLGGKQLVRRIGWEIALLLAVLLISMLPSANVFRWSFRWLPFLHLILAVLAAEAIQFLRLTSGERMGLSKLLTNPGAWAVALVALTIGGMKLASAGGPDAFPLAWITLAAATLWMATEYLPPRFSIVRNWTPTVLTAVMLITTYLCISPNGGFPKYELDERLRNPWPLDPARLYLSVYAQPEERYRREVVPAPFGLVLRPGSTSMWGGVRLINGYSPIRSAGVARVFASAIHGELDPDTAANLVEYEADANETLAILGIDGLLIEASNPLSPQPTDEWNLAFSSAEGRVYHRRGAPLGVVGSVESIGDRPNENFAKSNVKLVEDSRQRVLVDVALPADSKPALLTFSRPYFPGYRASLGGRALTVESYRGMMPVVKLPPGSTGRLALFYRPWWLVWGGAISIASLFGTLVAGAFAMFSSRRQ
jgi:hypothetical protein